MLNDVEHPLMVPVRAVLPEQPRPMMTARVESLDFLVACDHSWWGHIGCVSETIINGFFWHEEAH